MKEQTAPGAILKIDRVIMTVAKWFSYISGAVILCMAFLAFADIVASKFFGKTINNANALVEYMLIIVVYASVARAQLENGMMQVDLISNKFPAWLQKFINAAGCILGTFVYTMAAYKGIGLLTKHYSTKLLATASVTSFQIWPFTLVYVIGTFFLAFSLLWRFVRMMTIGNVAQQDVPIEGDLNLPLADEDVLLPNEKKEEGKD